MVSKCMLSLLAAAGLSLAAPRLIRPIVAPVPNDPLELATSSVREIKSPAKRSDLVQLLERARHNFDLRSGPQGYDLKVRFTVDSGGQTEYDGAWKMEDIFDPKLGHYWTADTSGSYAITRISSHEKLYGEETADPIPLRLQEARAALFDSIPAAKSIGNAAIRKSAAVFNNTRLTCLLLSSSEVGGRAIPGRRWDESEECIDPQTGLVKIHSQVPGRYFLYDYSNAPRFGDRTFPRKVTVTEAGRTVTTISVESLTELPSADPNLFVPTGDMKERGRAIAMARAQKIWRSGEVPAGAAAHAVCIFGVVTPQGKLVEAHSCSHPTRIARRLSKLPNR